MASNWTEFSAALGDVVLADAKRGLLRRSGAHCLPRRGPGAARGRAGLHRVCPFRTTPACAIPGTSGRAYIPFDQMPNAFDPPSGFLATANSRVTTDNFAVPALARMGRSLSRRAHLQDAARPRPAHADRHAGRADGHLQRGRSGAGASLCLRHRPHAREAADDPRLKKAADLMRSWDGRLTTDSAAASIVTQTRARPLAADSGAEAGQGRGRLPLVGVELCRGRDHHARQCGLASAGLQELGRAADRRRAQGDGRRQGAGRRGVAGATEAGTSSTSSIRWPDSCRWWAAWPARGRSR